MGNSNSYSDDELRRKVEANQFFFKGDRDLPVCNLCLQCNRQRFTDEEVALLSRPELTYAEFAPLDFGFLRMVNCSDCQSAQRFDTTPLARVAYNLKEFWFLEGSVGLTTPVSRLSR